MPEAARRRVAVGQPARGRRCALRLGEGRPRHALGSAAAGPSGHARLSGAGPRARARSGSSGSRTIRGSLYFVQLVDLPRGHARGGVSLYAADARLRRSARRAAPPGMRGPRIGAATPRWRAARIWSAPRETRAFISTTRSGRTRSTVAPFRIARAPVTNREFLEFVREGGYRRRDWWSAEGWESKRGERAALLERRRRRVARAPLLGLGAAARRSSGHARRLARGQRLLPLRRAGACPPRRSGRSPPRSRGRAAGAAIPGEMRSIPDAPTCAAQGASRWGGSPPATASADAAR